MHILLFIAFSLIVFVLFTRLCLSVQFNVSGWLKASSPSLTDCRTLLDHIFTGIKTADSVSAQSLLEV